MGCKLSWGVDGYGHRHYLCDEHNIYIGIATNAYIHNIEFLIEHGSTCKQFGNPTRETCITNE